LAIKLFDMTRVTIKMVLLCILFSPRLSAQAVPVPEWYFKNISAQVGVWVADNSEFKSNDEPYDVYAIEWEWGPLKNNIYGKLYGIKDSAEVATFWEFHQYWDRQLGEAVVVQIGWSNTIGKGVLIPLANNELDLVQTFVFGDGTQRQERHLYEMPDENTQITTSFSQEGKEWKKKRTYTWIKQ
jgi:hypothetical protein